MPARRLVCSSDHSVVVVVGVDGGFVPDLTSSVEWACVDAEGSGALFVGVSGILHEEERVLARGHVDCFSWVS